MEDSGQLHAPNALAREKTPGTDCTGRWVGPKGPDVLEKTISCPCRDSNSGSLIRSLVTISNSHCGSYLQNRVSYKDIKCAAFFINLLLPLSWALAKLKYGNRPV